MKVSFTDYYGQFVELTYETASGNIRIKVNTMENLNEIAHHTKDEMQKETDIALDRITVEFLIATLQMMVARAEK